MAVFRTPLIQLRMQEDPEFLSVLAKHADAVRTPAKALKALGLFYHPSAVNLTGYRDPLHGKIIYHCDPKTIYAAAPSFEDLALDPKPPPVRSGKPALMSHASGASGSINSSAVVSASSSSARAPSGSSADAPVVQAENSDFAEDIVPADSVLERPEYDGHMNDIFKTYVIRRITSFMDEREANAQASERTIISVRLTPGAIKSLCAAAVVAKASEEHEQAAVVAGTRAVCDVDVSRVALKGWVFLQLVRRRAASIVTPLARNQNIQSDSDWGVALLQVVKVLREDKKLHVSTTPVSMKSLLQSETAQLVLCLQALPIDSLLDLHSWTVQADLVCDLSLPTADASNEAARLSLAEDLLADGFFHLPGNDEFFQAKSTLLDQMVADDLVATNESGGFRLTAAGKNIITVASVLSGATRFELLRNCAVEEMDVVELLLTLHKAGWKHQSVHRKHLPCSSYVVGTSERVWFHELGKDSLNKDYLLLLLTAETHGQPVPHLQAASVYKSLLGQPSAPRRPAPGRIVFMQDDDLFIDETVLQPLKKRRAAPRRAKALRELDEHGLAADVALGPSDNAAEAIVDEAELDAELLGLAEELAAQAEDPAGPDVAESSSSSSSSSRSSKSSNDSSDSSSSSSSSSKSSAAPAPKRRPGFARNMHVSQAWGLCRLTPKSSSWQMSCGHPHHNDGQHCTKTRSNNLGGEELALRLLKAWALTGLDFDSKDSHQKDGWKCVQKMHKDNRLPSMEELDRQAIEHYPGAG